MDYTKQINMIADYLKPFCNELKKGEVVSARIFPYITLSVSGGFGKDIRISDERPIYQYYKYYNEYVNTTTEGEYGDGKHFKRFGAFRKMPDDIARVLILNWKTIKEEFLTNFNKFKKENVEIENFTI